MTRPFGATDNQGGQGYPNPKRPKLLRFQPADRLTWNIIRAAAVPYSLSWAYSPPPHTISIVSLNPNTGSSLVGQSQTFSHVVSDTAGGGMSTGVYAYE